MITLAFHEIKSPALKLALGVADNRSVVKKLQELGVPIKGKGKSKYVITDDILSALNESSETSYKAKSALSKMFK